MRARARHGVRCKCPWFPRRLLSQRSPSERRQVPPDHVPAPALRSCCLSPYRSHSADMTEHVGISESPGLGKALYRARGCAGHWLLSPAIDKLRCFCCCYSPCCRRHGADVTPNPRRVITGGTRTRVRNTTSVTPKERQEEGPAKGWLVLCQSPHPPNGDPSATRDNAAISPRGFKGCGRSSPLGCCCSCC